jgi:type I restriction enzyme R subunit
MNNGIKDETSSLVGKTIIFAQRQDHAEHLEKLFCKLYPQYGTKVCKVIHNAIPKAESLIKEFKKPKSDFRIAISVDMLDTGIDVPEIVNLVFAKPVRSRVKFWQMIGRGTRLSENLFGPGKHKQEFLIFDHYSNFAYFDEEYKEAEGAGSKSLLQTLFEARLELVESAIKANQADAFDVAVELIRTDINDLPDDCIPVKRELRSVHELQQTELLKEMSPGTRHTLSSKIAPLMGSRVLSDKYAIQFDRLIATIQRCLVDQASCFNDGRDQLLIELTNLAVTIQAVRRKDAVIKEVENAEFWQHISIDRLEHARKELRGIMKYRRSNVEPGVVTQTTGTKDGGVKDFERDVYLSGEAEALQYRRRLKAILDDMLVDNPILQKIYNEEPYQLDELKTLTSTILTSNPGVNLDILNQFYGRTANQLHETIRELIGMDPQAVEKHFTDFLHKHSTLTAQQVRFMNLLKNHISQHGTISVEKLYEPPFDSVSHEGVDGVFKPEDVDALVTVLKPFWSQESSQ